MDPIPTKLLKELHPVLGPPMSNIINSSLKVAVIKPLEKAKPFFISFFSGSGSLKN
jgi:hypothetical protein